MGNDENFSFFIWFHRAEAVNISGNILQISVCLCEFRYRYSEVPIWSSWVGLGAHIELSFLEGVIILGGEYSCGRAIKFIAESHRSNVNSFGKVTTVSSCKNLKCVST